MRSAFLILSDTKTFATKKIYDMLNLSKVSRSNSTLSQKQQWRHPCPNRFGPSPHFCGVMLFTLLPPPLLSRCGGGMIALYGNSGRRRGGRIFLRRDARFASPREVRDRKRDLVSVHP